jgi:hypothetical protein
MITLSYNKRLKSGIVHRALTRPLAATKVGRIGNPSYKDVRTARASYDL